MLSPVRPSVYRLSVARVNHPKTVEVRIMQFSPYCSPIPLGFRVSSKNSNGLPERGRKQGRVGKTSHFLALNVTMSQTVADTSKVTYYWLLGSCICAFDCHQDR